MSPLHGSGVLGTAMGLLGYGAGGGKHAVLVAMGKNQAGRSTSAPPGSEGRLVVHAQGALASKRGPKR